MIKFIKQLPRFERGYKKLKKKHYSLSIVAKAVQAILDQNKIKLIKLNRHHLHGDLKGFQEVHVSDNPDILILYEIVGDTLVLVKIGSHDDLFK